MAAANLGTQDAIRVDTLVVLLGEPAIPILQHNHLLEDSVSRIQKFVLAVAPHGKAGTKRGQYTKSIRRQEHIQPLTLSSVSHLGIL